MYEAWLKTNRRILLLGMILPAVLVVVGLIVVVAKPLAAVGWLQVAGWILLAAGLFLFAIFALQLRQPRLACTNDSLLVFLRSGPPFRVPLEVVECFFLGAGGGQVPGKSGSDLKVRNLVIRIAEKAADFQRREVKSALGSWQDGYITIFGAWCEPLELSLVNRLNARLAEVKSNNQEAATNATTKTNHGEHGE